MQHDFAAVGRPAALALAFDFGQGETQLILKWRQRGKPTDPVMSEVRRAVVKQLFDRRIAAGESRQRAVYGVQKQLGMSHGTVEKLLAD